MSVSNVRTAQPLDPALVHHDSLSEISLHLDRSTAISLASVSQAFRSLSDDLILQKYEATFGRFNKNSFSSLNGSQVFDSKPLQPVLTRLLSCAGKEPNEDVPSIVYQEPKSFLERWKWLVGVQNKFDTEVQQNDQNQVHALEQTAPCSILQLKNQMTRFWYLDQRMEAYQQFKAETLARRTRIQKLFFACISFILKCFGSSGYSMDLRL